MEKDQPLVSVITITRNRGTLIPRAKYFKSDLF